MLLIKDYTLRVGPPPEFDRRSVHARLATGKPTPNSPSDRSSGQANEVYELVQLRYPNAGQLPL